MHVYMIFLFLLLLFVPYIYPLLKNYHQQNEWQFCSSLTWSLEVLKSVKFYCPHKLLSLSQSKVKTTERRDLHYSKARVRNATNYFVKWHHQCEKKTSKEGQTKQGFIWENSGWGFTQDQTSRNPKYSSKSKKTPQLALSLPNLQHLDTMSLLFAKPVINARRDNSRIFINTADRFPLHTQKNKTAASTCSLQQFKVNSVLNLIKVLINFCLVSFSNFFKNWIISNTK